MNVSSFWCLWCTENLILNWFKRTLNCELFALFCENIFQIIDDVNLSLRMLNEQKDLFQPEKYSSDREQL